MNYKIEKTLKKTKKVIIIVIVLWLTLTIVLATPMARSIVEAKKECNGYFDIEKFIDRMWNSWEHFGESLGTPFKRRIYKNIFKNRRRHNFICIICSNYRIYKNDAKA